MIFLSNQYKEEWKSLVQEVRNFLQLEVRYVALDATERVASLLAQFVLIVVMFFFGFLVLLAGAFSGAFWLGDLLGSLAAGFLVVGFILLLLLLLVYANRMNWIFLPIMRIITSILLKKGEEDADDAE